MRLEMRQDSGDSASVNAWDPLEDEDAEDVRSTSSELVEV